MKYGVFSAIFCIGFCFNQLCASQLVVSSDIGFDPVDSTNFLQFAFSDTIEDTIVVDNVGMDWNIGPLSIDRNDITIIFEEGVVLRALTGAFDIFESLVRVNDKSNINIVGYEALFVMNKQEYIELADSEFRHGISLNSATNVLVEGLTIVDTGGDGILVTRSFQPNSIKNYCENVLIKNCKFSNNYRQGLSVTSAKNLSILNCEFSETNGTLPEDGIDLEPDIPEERLENILIKDCRIFNNYGNAIQLALFMMDDDSPDVSITIEDTYMSNNHHPSNTFDFAEISATDNNSNGVDGFVHFKNCYIESSQWTAVYASKTVDSYDLDFTNCVFKNVSSNPVDLNNPIFFEVTDYDNPVARFGGLSFTDCTIIYDANIPFLNLIENLPTSDGLGNVSGHFYIVNPNDAGFNTGVNPDNVDISYDYFDSIPISEISLTSNQLDYLEEDEFIEFELTRTGSQEIPIAVEFVYDGTAQYGVDYNRANGFAIMPSNSGVLVDTLEIIQDSDEESPEFLDLTFLDNACIQLSQNNELVFSIGDMLSSISPDSELENPKVTLVPNPAQKEVFIETESANYDLSIFDSKGRMIKSFFNESLSKRIEIEQLSIGTYYIRIVDKASSSTSVYKLVKN